MIVKYYNIIYIYIYLYIFVIIRKLYDSEIL